MTTISSIDARFAQDQVGIASGTVKASIANLVSGKKADANVADLSVGTILATRVGTLRVTLGNAGQAKSLLETAKGALDTVLSLLQQQKSLAVKSADDSLSDNERGFLNQEFQAIVSEIDRISDSANFNGKALLDGSISGNAGVNTTTGLPTENYTLLQGGQYGLSGTVASGDLSTTVATRSKNTITFGAIGTGAAESITIADTAGVFGPPAAETELTSVISYTTVTGATAAETAAVFVAAANAKTDIIARQFEFIDNGDGTVQVNARHAGDDVEGMTFTGSDHDGTLRIGNDGTGSDIDGAAALYSATRDASSVGVDGTFRTIQSANVAETFSTNTITIAGAADNTAVTNVIIGGDTVAVNITNLDTAEDQAAKIVAALNADTGDEVRRFNYSSSGAVITITNTIAGPVTANDSIAFDVLDNANTGITYTMSGVDLEAGAATSFDTENATFTAGTLRDTDVTDIEQTFEETLQGGFSNFSGTFTTGVSGANNSVQFSVEVGGKTYTSQVVQLYGTSSDTILANTALQFSDPDGPIESGTSRPTDQAFELRIGSAAETGLTNQTTLNTFVDGIEAQLSANSITQERSLGLEQVSASTGDHRITAAVGTILEGLRGFDATGSDSTQYNAGDILLNGDSYATSGTLGSIESFTVSRLTDTITTTIDGEVYTAYLNSATAPTTGGIQSFGTNDDGSANTGAYNSTTKILDLTDGTALGSTPKLVFYSASTTDGKTLTVDLGNVSLSTSQINISTAAGESALKAALDATFDVSANDSLSFQVGAASTDTIGVSIGSAKTTDVYKDDDGVSQTLSVATIEEATAAGSVIDNAINNVVSLISDISAKITSFNSAIQNNQASIQNADAARSKLLDTDYTQESTRFAESRVRVDAATAVLSQVNSRIQNLLQLLQQ